MMFGASVHFYMQLLWLYQNERKNGKNCWHHQKLWIWFNGNLPRSKFHSFHIIFQYWAPEKNKLNLPIIYHNLPAILPQRSFNLACLTWKFNLQWGMLVLISCFWLIHGTLVPVFSYSHNHVPIKPRLNEQYKVAFNIRLLTKSCSFRHLHFQKAAFDFCWKLPFKCFVHAKHILV